MPTIRVQDIADIIIMSVLVYQLYIWFRNTKTLQVLIGIGLAVALYLVTKTLGLFMTSWILQEMGTVFFILIIVIFQKEIRQTLYRFSLLRNFFEPQPEPASIDLLELSSTLFSFGSSRTGALVVFQRSEAVEEYLLHGVPLDSLPGGPLLSSIFNPGAPLHDGAVVIRNGRVFAASCHLPLSARTDIPQHYGTRHRAALGLSEACDAVVAVVSEERGEVSLAVAGVLEPCASAERLAERLHLLLVRSSPEKERAKLADLVFRNLRPKIAVLALVVLCWVVLTARQGELVSVTAPVRFHGLSDRLVLVKSSPEEIDVTVKAFSRFVPSPKNMDINADIDLSSVREGSVSVPVRKEDLRLPLGASVSSIDPGTVRVVIDKKVRKSVKVEVPTTRHPRGRLRLAVSVSPEYVTVEGPEKSLARVTSVETEELDLSRISRSGTFQKSLLSSDPSVRIVGGDSVAVTVTATRSGGR